MTLISPTASLARRKAASLIWRSVSGCFFHAGEKSRAHKIVEQSEGVASGFDSFYTLDEFFDESPLSQCIFFFKYLVNWSDFVNMLCRLFSFSINYLEKGNKLGRILSLLTLKNTFSFSLIEILDQDPRRTNIACFRVIVLHYYYFVPSTLIWVMLIRSRHYLYHFQYC